MQRSAALLQTSLSSLPPELHDKIWSLTFSSRTISIYLHEGRTADDPAHTSAIFPPSRDCQLKPACIVFTAALGVEPPFLQVDRLTVKNGSDKGFTVTAPMRMKPPPGPVALQVCRQSRNFAKKHYELSFAGVNFIAGDVKFEELWKMERLGEKKIWANFELDVFVFHHADARSSIWGHRNGCSDDLSILAAFAQDEASKMRNLALTGMWPDPFYFPRSCRFKLAFGDTIANFGNLENVLLHNTDAYRRFNQRTRIPNVTPGDLRYCQGEITQLMQIRDGRVIKTMAISNFKIITLHPHTDDGRIPEKAPIQPPTPPPSTAYLFPGDEGISQRVASVQAWLDRGHQDPQPQSHSILDYSMQLMLLEQRQKRITLETDEAAYVTREIAAWRAHTGLTVI